MKQSLLNRLERLEKSNSHGGIGILTFLPTGVFEAKTQGKTWLFDTEKEALSFLNNRTACIIVIDI